MDSIPQAWKKKIKEYSFDGHYTDCNILENGSIKSLFEISNKQLYDMHVKAKYDKSKANITYSQQFNITENEWEQIYFLPYRVNVSNKAKEFQYKVLHRYLGTKLLLYKIGKLDTPRCNLCYLYEQNVEHLLVFCNIAHNFWLKVSNWLTLKTNITVKLQTKDILFGYELNNPHRLINQMILYGRMFIFKSAFRDEPLNFELFLQQYCCKYGLTCPEQIFSIDNVNTVNTV